MWGGMAKRSLLERSSCVKHSHKLSSECTCMLVAECCWCMHVNPEVLSSWLLQKAAGMLGRTRTPGK